MKQWEPSVPIVPLFRNEDSDSALSVPGLFTNRTWEEPTRVTAEYAIG